MEANYFRNCKYPMMTSLQGTDVYAGGTKRDPKNNGTFSNEEGGSIKAYNNYMEGAFTFIPHGASKYMLKGKETSVGDIDTKADFDAYVVEKRDEQVPSSVKSYAGANVYNNFDTDKSIMYSYTADEPATARDNVVRYAGRVQGGDFKWAFDNSVDDAASEVNQKLKDALMAYKGSNGEVMDYSSSSVIPDSVPGSSSSKEEQALAKLVPSNGYLFYDSNSDRLVVGTKNVVRLDIIGIDGHRVDVAGLKKVGDIRVLDLSSLRAGVYIVRLSTWMTTQTIKFVKKP